MYVALWALMLASEPAVVIWEACSGTRFYFNWATELPLWPCSIFLFVAPVAFFGRGKAKLAACGYVCTLGLLGGAINFVYPATYLARYSCLSFPGLRTIFYHGSMVFTAATMLLSGEHSFRGVTRWEQLALPAVPALLFAIPSMIANALIPGADYMFFGLNSFFFAPLGRVLQPIVSALIVAAIYLVIHAAPYWPSYRAHRKMGRTS